MPPPALWLSHLAACLPVLQQTSPYLVQAPPLIYTRTPSQATGPSPSPSCLAQTSTIYTDYNNLINDSLRNLTKRRTYRESRTQPSFLTLLLNTIWSISLGPPTPTPTPSPTPTRAHTPPDTHTYIHTHTHTYILSLSLSLFFSFLPLPPKLPVQKTPGMLRIGVAALAGAGVALAAVRFGDRLQRQNSGGPRRSAANERSCAAKAGSPGEQAETASDWGSPVHPPERDGNKTMSPSRLPRPRQLFSDRDQSRNEVQSPTHARRCRSTALRCARPTWWAAPGMSLLSKHARGVRADGVRARRL
jgi:hypothetical protein